MTIFNVSIEEERYVKTILRSNATEVAGTSKNYTRDLEEEHPHELWALLHFSLQHMVTY